jgi:hypothetical protein
MRMAEFIVVTWAAVQGRLQQHGEVSEKSYSWSADKSY